MGVFSVECQAALLWLSESPAWMTGPERRNYILESWGVVVSRAIESASVYDVLDALEIARSGKHETDPLRKKGGE